MSSANGNDLYAAFTPSVGQPEVIAPCDWAIDVREIRRKQEWNDMACIEPKQTGFPRVVSPTDMPP